MNKILRWLFAVLLLTTAIGKLLDNRGFAAVLETYRVFPTQTLLSLGLTISLGELLLAGLLVLRRYARRVAAAIVLLHVGYLLLAVVTLLRGIHLDNCGCFGVFLARPLTIWTPVEDAFLLALAIVYLATLENGE